MGVTTLGGFENGSDYDSGSVALESLPRSEVKLMGEYAPRSGVPVATLAAVALTLLASASLAQTPKGTNSSEQQELSDVIQKCQSSVVLIEVRDKSDKVIKSGSGFIASPDGKIVTNYHVIKGAYSAFVKLNSGAFFKVEGLVASDEDTDIAIVKVGSKSLPALEFGDSDKALVGQSVIAIGSPLGLENTVSNGIVSGLREDSGKKWIQTTAPASPGNSGGPLINSSGVVVGMITWKVVGGENLNFAVPSNSVRNLLAFAGSSLKPLDSMASHHFKFVQGQLVYVMTNDFSIKRKAEEQFAKDGQFRVAGGLSGADFVFVALWDKSSNEELIVVVLPDDYPQYKADLDGLRDHSVWQGGGQVRPGSIWNPARSEVKILVKRFEREIVSQLSGVK